MSASQTEIGFADGYLDIPHNSDGTKSFSVSFSFTPQTSASYFPGSMSGSGTFTCTPIARATTPTLSKSSLDLGTAVTITATPAVNTFTHKLYYQIGTGSPTLLSELAAGTQSYSWTVPLSLANNFTSSQTGTVVVVCETYSGTTLIGTSNVNLTVIVPTSAKPTISNVTISEAVTNPNIASQFGAYIQNRSKLRVVTAATAQYGATIQGCTVSVGDETYSGTTIVTNELRSSGSVSVTVTVTDSRGYSTTSTQTVNVVAYNPPTITVAEAVRCDSSGTPDDNGEYVRFTYSYNITNIGTANKNNPSFVISRYDGSAWETLYTKTDYTASNTVSYSTSFTFDIQTEYKVRFTISDFFTTSTGTQTVVMKEVHPSFVLLDFGAGGKSVAIGQLSSNNGKLEVDLPSVFHNGAVLASKMRVTSMNIAPSADKRSSVEHYLATSSCSAANGKPAYDSHIIHLHWDNESGYDIQIALPDVVRSDTAAREVQASTIQYRTQNGKNGAWHPWRNAALNAYPVGSTYESTSNTDPATLFGGTWTQIQTHETLTVTGTKVVSSSTYDGNMHTLEQVKDLFEEKYGFRPTLSGTVSAKQQTFDSTNVADSTYTDLGVIYYNGHWEASNQTLVPILTHQGQLAVRMSATGLTMRVNYTYITHRTMYKWTRTA